METVKRLLHQNHRSYRDTIIDLSRQHYLLQPHQISYDFAGRLWRNCLETYIHTVLWSGPIPNLHSTCLWFFNLKLEGAMKLKFFILLAFRCTIARHHFLSKSKFSISGQKPWTIYNPWFDFWQPKKVLRKACQLKEYEKGNLMMLVSAA